MKTREFAERFLESRKINRCAESTIDNYEWVMNRLNASFGQVPGRGVRVRHPDCTAQAAVDCVSGASCSASCFVVTPGVR